MDTPSLKRLIYLTSKTPAVLEFLSGGSFSVPFAESSLSIQLFRTGMFQSSVLEPLFRLQAFSSHLNQFRGFKCHLNLLASGIFSFPPDLFSVFLHPGLCLRRWLVCNLSAGLSVPSGWLWTMVNSGRILGEREEWRRSIYSLSSFCVRTLNQRRLLPRLPSVSSSLFPRSYNNYLPCSFGIWDTQDIPLFFVFPYTPTSKNWPLCKETLFKYS